MASLPSPELELARLRARNAELEATLAAQMHRAVALEQAEAALRASETKYHTLFETMAQGVVYQAADGQISACNPAAERILGLSLAQMQERTSLDPRWRAIHGDGSPFPGETHPAMVALRTGQAVRNVLMGVYHWRDDSYHWLSVNAVPEQPPGATQPVQVYTTFDDITERVQAEQALRTNQQNLEALIENTDGSIWSVDPAYHLIVGNRLYQEYVAQVLGRTLATGESVLLPSFPAAALAEWQAYYDQALGGARFSVEVPTRFRAVQRLVDYHFNPITTAEGQIVGVTVFGRDITERKQAEEALRTSHARLQALGERLVTVQEEERRHLARELHDEIGQTLTGLNLILSIGATLPPSLLEARLSEARRQVGALIAHISRRSLDLRPTLLDDLGLRAALVWYLERYTEQTNIAVTFQEAGLDLRVAPLVELTAYRIVQEALTNVARHAEVATATVQVWVVNTRLVIQVMDSGRGFDVGAALRAHATSGLAGMRERARLLGGELTIEAEPGGGTRLLADLPCAGQAATVQALP